MSQMPAITGMTTRSKPTADVYSVMLMIATVFVLAATIFVFYKSQIMLGGILPVAGD